MAFTRRTSKQQLIYLLRNKDRFLTGSISKAATAVEIRERERERDVIL